MTPIFIYSSLDPTALPLRLVDGMNSSGRVEVFYGGLWGTICNSSWDLNDSQVACRQLGFTHASAEDNNASYVQGSGPVWMTNFGCNAEDDRLERCSYDLLNVGEANCSHSEDVGVVCSGRGKN